MSREERIAEEMAAELGDSEATPYQKLIATHGAEKALRIFSARARASRGQSVATPAPASRLCATEEGPTAAEDVNLIRTARAAADDFIAGDDPA